MKVSFHMNLSELAQCIGDATETESRHMRKLLSESIYNDTEEVPDSVWSKMLEDTFIHLYK